MSTKRPSRSESSDRARAGAQFERHTQAYREYLLDRGNAAGYVLNGQRYPKELRRLDGP